MALTHTQETDDYVTVSEAARISYLSNDTIRRYADKGILATVRTPSNHRRFRRSDVLALLSPAPASVSPEATDSVGGASSVGDAA